MDSTEDSNKTESIILFCHYTEEFDNDSAVSLGCILMFDSQATFTFETNDWEKF